MDYNLLVFDQNQIPIFSKHYSNQNVVQETISAEGAYEWSVEALDVLGFKIPHLYRVPIYFIHEPLEAPQLEAPVLKKPPEDSPQSSLKKFYKLHFLNILKNLFIETAYASSDKYEAIFSWKPVSGALRYVIEIDDEPNFRSPLVIKKVNKTSFNWKNFKLGQYYWRVAAEGKNEQMGLFSSVSKADLSDPKLFLNTHSGNLKVKKIEEATEIKFEEPISPQAVQEDTKPIEVKVSEPVKMVEKEVSKPIHGYFLWEPTYELSEYRNEDPTRASFTGIYFISFDARIDVPVGATEDVSLRLKYKDSSFKPNPDNEYPFQENLNRNKISFSSYYGASFKPRLGIKAETLQGIKRKSFEEIEFNSYIGFGPSLLWPLSENKHYSTLESSLLLLSQGWNFGLELKLLKDFELSSRLKGLYGIGFEASYFQLTDQRGYQIYPYLSIGLHW